MRIMILTENVTTYSYTCDHSDHLQPYPYKYNLFSYLAGLWHTCPYIETITVKVVGQGLCRNFEFFQIHYSFADLTFFILDLWGVAFGHSIC